MISQPLKLFMSYSTLVHVLFPYNLSLLSFPYICRLPYPRTYRRMMITSISFMTFIRKGKILNYLVLDHHSFTLLVLEHDFLGYEFWTHSSLRTVNFYHHQHNASQTPHQGPRSIWVSRLLPSYSKYFLYFKKKIHRKIHLNLRHSNTYTQCPLLSLLAQNDKPSKPS